MTTPRKRAKDLKLPPPLTPAPTPELIALTPQLGEAPLDALARVGEDLIAATGDETKDTRRDKKLPRQLGAMVALRAQGFDNVEIAERLGIDKRQLRALLAKARHDFGWNDLNEKLIDVALPIAVDNIVKHLEYEGTALGVIKGESVMTRALAAGLGTFKSHSAVKQETKNETTNVLRVEITLPQLPPGVQGSSLTDGSVLATPRRALVSPAIPALAASVIDAEVVG